MKLKFALHVSWLFLLVAGGAAGQNSGYRVSGLTADRPGANHQSATLLNPWGIAFLPGGQGFFIAENASGRVDSYDATGNFLVGITIPPPAGSTAPFSKPTGIAADPEGNFGPPTARIQFVVAADNGTIWSIAEMNAVPQAATLFANNSAGGAEYTGIAVLHPDSTAAYVAAANFSQGRIDTFAGPNVPLGISSNQFIDPNLPAGYAPFNIQKLGNQVFVVYAVPDAAHHPVPSPGSALVNIFDLEGNFVRRFISPGAAANVLVAPLGITQASANFGRFGTAILIGNLEDGSINAFDPGGNFLGQLTDATGNELFFVGLRGLAFRADGLGDPNALYEVAGAQFGQPPAGAFGAITTALATTTTLDVPTPAVFGAPVTLTANTSSLAGIPAGTITFFDGSNLIGQQGLSATGLATLTLTSLGVGSHNFTAQYIGNFDNSTSNAVSVTISNTTPSRYHFTPILSDLPGLPSGIDRFLKNPWGLTFIPGGAFWTAENRSTNISTFDETGALQLPDNIRVELANGASARPTGIVFNPTAAVSNGDFTLPGGTPGQVLSATEDGIIAGWGTVAGEILPVAPIARDDSASGAVYKGLSIIDPGVSRPYLAVPDFNHARVQTYSNTFGPFATSGGFADPTLPHGFAPFNIQVIGAQVFITYALQDATQHDPVVGPGNGIVNIFDVQGNFIRRFASNGVLNAPWGIIQASANFGDFSNDILIGNFGDGTINAFDPATGNFVGTLKDEAGVVNAAPGLWGLTFRSDNGTVDPNTLFFVQGQNGGADGLFGSLTVTAPPATLASSVAVSFSGGPSTNGLPPNTEPFGTIFSLIADVTAASGTPTGAVSFYDGLTPLGSAPVINGRASAVNTVPLSTGPHVITARYSGDATFLLSKNTATLHIIGKADTVTLTVPGSAVLGSPVTLTATVSAPQGSPTGTVSFQDGATTLGTASLNAAGMATLTLNTLISGTHTIVAVYSGDFAFQSGTSQPATLIVQTTATATHFAVSAPATAAAGSAFNFTVTALDAANHTTTAYSGTVHFTSSDGTATLPANATLISGAGTFSASLHTSGGQTITATDTVTATITGTTNTITVSAAAATHFTVSAPTTAAPGSAFNFTVTALDSANHIATAYSGTVHFTSSDAAANLPANATLANGAGTFSATLHTNGSQTITATDTVIATTAGTTNSITVSAGAATRFAVLSPATVTAGNAFNFTVTAIDGAGNTVTSYGGTVHFTSSDAAAALPANATLTAGTGTFSATLRTGGNQTITATDTVTTTLTGGTMSAVTTANRDFSFAAMPPSATVMAGGSTQFMLTITPAGGFGDQVSFSCTPVAGISCAFNPATVTPANGAASTTLTVSTSSSVTRYGLLPFNRIAPSVPLATLALFSLFIISCGGILRNTRTSLLTATAVLAIVALSVTLGGCGGYGSKTQPNRGTASIMVTAQSGAISHTATVNVTVQ